MRMRAAFSTTRAPILSRRRLSWLASGLWVRGELALVQLDQVLGLAAGAVENFVEMPGLASPSFCPS